MAANIWSVEGPRPNRRGNEQPSTDSVPRSHAGPQLDTLIRAGRHRFRVAEYVADHARFSTELQHARESRAQAWCSCSNPPRPLVIRRVRHADGDTYCLAAWPNDRHRHHLRCPLISPDSHARTPGGYARIPGIVEGSASFFIRPAFSLGTEPRKVTPARMLPGTGHSGVPRAKASLTAIVRYIWEGCGLNRFSPGCGREWSTVQSCLSEFAQRGRISSRRLDQMLYIVPPFAIADAVRINRTRAAFLDARTSGERFLLLGELDLAARDTTTLRCVRHFPRTLAIGESLAADLLKRFPATRCLIARSVAGRVVALYLVERGATRRQLSIIDGALLSVSNSFTPADSSHEVSLANLLEADRRCFEKPMRPDTSGFMPDFVLTDVEPRLIMEIWGMDNAAYLAHKSEKLHAYDTRGYTVWNWEPARDRAISPIPPRATRAD